MAFIIALILVIASFYGAFIVIAGVHDYLVLCSGWVGDMLTGIFEWWHPFAFILVLGLSWFLAGMSKNMYSINGSGTKLFGRTPTANGYIATKWICMFFVPILPVDSYEVFAEQKVGTQSSFAMNQLEDLYWRQISVTGVKGLLAFIGFVVFMAIIFNLVCFSVA